MINVAWGRRSMGQWVIRVNGSVAQWVNGSLGLVGQWVIRVNGSMSQWVSGSLGLMGQWVVRVNGSVGQWVNGSLGLASFLSLNLVEVLKEIFVSRFSEYSWSSFHDRNEMIKSRVWLLLIATIIVLLIFPATIIVLLLITATIIVLWVYN